uniref:Uncharacterized protein n=1 Tax=Candidatus Kentrum sp. DK TaxID=2126562 RepID=A0A450SC69_9GAMM|nr:MAG: hypothetical protein BECKDK2373C_GA0170839_102721 [Candidatus Kentron sp. DK]
MGNQPKKQRLSELRQRMENLQDVGDGQAIRFQERRGERLQQTQELSERFILRDKEIDALEKDVRDMEVVGKEIEKLAHRVTQARERLGRITGQVDECIGLSQAPIFAGRNGGAGASIPDYLDKLRSATTQVDGGIRTLLVETVSAYHVDNERFDLEQKESWINEIEAPVDTLVVALRQTNAFAGRQSAEELAHDLLGLVGGLVAIIAENPGRALSDGEREKITDWNRELNRQLGRLGNTSEPEILQGSEMLVNELLMWQQRPELGELKGDIQYAITAINQTKTHWKNREEQEIEQAIRQGEMVFRQVRETAMAYRAEKLEKLGEELALLRGGGSALAEIESLVGGVSRDNETIKDLQGHEAALVRIEELEQRYRESSRASLPAIQDKLHERISQVEVLLSNVDTKALSTDNMTILADIRSELAHAQPDSDKNIDYHLGALRKTGEWRADLTRLWDEAKTWRERVQIRTDDLGARQKKLKAAIAESKLTFTGVEGTSWDSSISTDTRGAIDSELDGREAEANRLENTFADVCYEELSALREQASNMGTALATGEGEQVAELPSLPSRQDIGLDVLVAALLEARWHLETVQTRLEQESQDCEHWCREIAPRMVNELITSVDREAVRQLKDALAHLPEGLSPEEHFERLSRLRGRWQILIRRIQGTDRSLEEERKRLFLRLGELHEKGLTDYCPPLWVGRVSDLIHGLPEAGSELRSFQDQITISTALLENVERHFLRGASGEIRAAKTILKAKRSHEADVLLSELKNQPDDQIPPLELRQRLRQAASLRGCTDE